MGVDELRGSILSRRRTSLLNGISVEDSQEFDGVVWHLDNDSSHPRLKKVPRVRLFADSSAAKLVGKNCCTAGNSFLYKFVDDVFEQNFDRRELLPQESRPRLESRRLDLAVNPSQLDRVELYLENRFVSINQECLN
ncbi:hypothetical protein HAX54_002011 [Datura stramonium]|uniref:Uncharacterized protein n=1 Tax=Datura stramonium TaxID=4076 RepID=A0ABS8T387_DATST|nr:hypothetical protein [Datura stramonium]